MADIVMPRLSDTMEEGTILRWLAADGQEIHRGDELVEIETDKATMVYESDQEGVLQTVAAEGDSLPVGELIARVGGDGGPAARTPGHAAQAGAAQAGAGQAGAGQAGAGQAGAGQAGAAQAQPAPPAVVARTDGAAAGDTVGAGQAAAQPAPTAPAPGSRVKASPLARRIAREHGIDLRGLTGSGPGGRIVRHDVQSATQGHAPAQPARTSDAPATAHPGAPRAEGTEQVQPAGAGVESVLTAKGAPTTVELSRTQQTIARRMAESKATIPHFAIELDVDMEACVALRAQLGRVAGAVRAPQEGGAGSAPASAGDPTPTYNDMVVKASALALRAHPRANSSYRDGRLQLHERVNVGVAVATEGEQQQGGALIVPTVFDADRKALGEISREARALAARVRDGSITPPELSGGTFTVSNLGMFGVRSFSAIINPPQAAILSVGAVRALPAVHDGEIEARHIMSLTLACDHRILYGADAARFLAHIRELLEEPAALML